MIFQFLLIISLVTSPIWPLGENPLPGDPYIVVNKLTNEIAFIVENKVENIYKVSTGKVESDTPEGEFTVVVKASNPYYRKKNIEGGAKENPLGTRWIGFDANGTDGRIFGIHGNNNPSTIGKYITGGCVRMFNEEVEELYNKVPLGTKVLITKTDMDFEDIGKGKGAIARLNN